MTIAIILMGGLGLLVGIGLAAASKVFYVYVDPKIVAVEEALPGANCGGCGLPGCSANAEAIVAGKASPNSCVAAGDETALAIAAILGVSVEAKEPDIALPGCTYGVADADVKYSYDGLNDCRAAAPARRRHEGLAISAAWAWAPVPPPVPSTPSSWAPRDFPWWTRSSVPDAAPANGSAPSTSLRCRPLPGES